MDTVGKLHLIFPERFNRGKCCPRPFKNVKEQAKALLNLLVRVKYDFVVVIINKSGRQPRLELTPSGFVQSAPS